jgi:hypothetical protein
MKTTKHSDMMFTMVAQYDPAQGVVFRWWANNVYFGLDKDTSNEVFVEIKDATIEILRERGLIMKRQGEFHGLH